MSASKAEQAIVAERRSKALALRVQNAPLQQIADQLGYGSASAVSQDITRALRARKADLAEVGDALVALQVEKLEAMERLAWQIARRKHVVVSQGRVMRDSAGEPLLDDDVTLRAIDRMVKIQERLAKALGTDAPLRAKVEVRDEFDADIERLIGELAATPTRGETETAGPAGV